VIDLTVTVNQNYQMHTRVTAERNIKAEMRKWLMGTAVPLANSWVDAHLRQQPGRPRYPLAWASEKQRRYVMAKLRRQNNLPYRRTGALVKSWEAAGEANDNAGTVTTRNPAGMAGYVYAPYNQQPFHAVTGWMNVQPIFSRMTTALSDRLMEDWPGIVRGSVMK
jgi:hypothetical protein